MAKVKNTYIKGIDQDTSVNKRDPSTYYSAYNIRVLLNEELASGAITNIKGTLNLDLALHLSNALLVTGLKGFSNFAIVGAGDIRDYLILFVSGSNAFGVSSNFIFKILVDKWGISTTTLIYTDVNTVDGSTLDFSTNYPIRGFASYYEDDNIQQIYWTTFRTDTFTPLKVMNIAASLKVGLQWVSANSFNIIPEFSITTPTITAIYTGGSLTSGLVQYAYQLYNKYGTESYVSPLSNLAHITPSNTSLLTSTDYKGGEAGEYCGKAVGIAISVSDTRFNRIKIYAIHYETENSVPIIYLLEDKPVSTTVYSIDGGNNYLGTISLEEFVSLQSNFTCKDLAIKDNILFATNIKTYNFDFTYDARAYRFPRESNFTRIYKSDGTYDVLGYGGTYTWGNVTSIPETHDAINIANTYTTETINPPVNGYFYKRDDGAGAGLKLGGSGWNVSYEFELESQTINEAPTADQIYTILDGGHFKGYEDYAKVSLRDFQRDEVYRFGIVGYNSKFQPSPVKWIGDIRIPKHNDVDSTYTATANSLSNGYSAFANSTASSVSDLGNVLHNRLNIKFTVNNLPTTVSYYQIVYVKREEADKTVLAEGLVGHAILDTDVYKLPLRGFTLIEPAIAGYGTPEDSILQFISPDVLYSKNLQFNSGDYLQANLKVFSPETNDLVFKENSTSFEDVTYPVVAYTQRGHYNNITTQFRAIDNLYLADTIPQANIESYGIDINQAHPFLNWTQGGTGASEHYGVAGSKAIITLDTAFDDSGMTAGETFYVQYKRPRANQYGGSSYASRLTNTYIPCSPITPRTTTTIRAYGDVYASMLDYIYTMWLGIGGTTEVKNAFSVINFPVISKYNCSLEIGEQPHQALDETGYWLMTETADTHTTDDAGTDVSFIQAKNRYLYNTVYNRQSDILQFIPKQDDYSVISIEDTTTKYSNAKLPKSYIDPWTKFATLNSKAVDTRYGGINKLEVLNNQLIFIQDKAIGIWLVNARELINTNNPGALSLGTGGVMSQYQYITTSSGSTQQFSVVNTSQSIYYFDTYNKGIYRFSGGERANISKISGLSTLFKNLNYGTIDSPIINSNYGVIAGYNKEFDEIIFNVRGLNPNNVAVNYNVSYNELNAKFCSFYSTSPKIFKHLNGILLSTDNLGKLYVHDADTYGKLYDSYYDSTITTVVNPQIQVTKQLVFSDINFTSTCTLDDVETDISISTLEAHNSYQQSVTLNFESNPELLVQRNRIYRTYLPRENNAEESRLADTYLILNLGFRNRNNYKFTLHDIETGILINTL